MQTDNCSWTHRETRLEAALRQGALLEIQEQIFRLTDDATLSTAANINGVLLRLPVSLGAEIWARQEPLPTSIAMHRVSAPFQVGLA
jgi:hypothetical protein